MASVRVLFVCLGNICRSPLAEAIFKQRVKQLGLEDVLEAHSCGTADYHIGVPPDARTIANAKKNGVSIEHLGRQLEENDLEYFDFILAMDNSNHRNILRLENALQHSHKIMLMREFDPQRQGGEVPDPYYGGEHQFQEVFTILDRSIDAFLQYLSVEKLKDKN